MASVGYFELLEGFGRFLIFLSAASFASPHGFPFVQGHAIGIIENVGREALAAFFFAIVGQQ